MEDEWQNQFSHINMILEKQLFLTLGGSPPNANVLVMESRIKQEENDTLVSVLFIQQ